MKYEKQVYRPPAPSVCLRHPAPSRREPLESVALRIKMLIHFHNLEDEPPSGREGTIRRMVEGAGGRHLIRPLRGTFPKGEGLFVPQDKSVLTKLILAEYEDV